MSTSTHTLTAIPVVSHAQYKESIIVSSSVRKAKSLTIPVQDDAGRSKESKSDSKIRKQEKQQQQQQQRKEDRHEVVDFPLKSF